MPPVTAEFIELQAALAGRYSLDRELGRGGNGIVYLAQDVALQRPVAIKLLPPALAHRPEVRERFLREARTAAGLSHPHIVPIHLVEERTDLLYFVMAFIEGETLAERVRRVGAMPPTAVVRLMQEVSWALGYAHDHGIVHRDVKPDNVMLERRTDRAIVMDFGIARVTTANTLSSAGELVGTVQFMSPEQATGEPVDARSDLYSLGATAFFALTGESPHTAPSLPALLLKLSTQPAPLVAERVPDLPAPVAEAIQRCLAQKRTDRYESAEALTGALAGAVAQRPTVSPEVRRAMRDLVPVAWLTGVDAIVMGSAVLLRSTGAISNASLLPTMALGTLFGFLCAMGVVSSMSILRIGGLTWSDVELELAREYADRAEESRALRRRWLTEDIGWVTRLGGWVLGVESILMVVMSRVAFRSNDAMFYKGFLGGAVLLGALSVWSFTPAGRRQAERRMEARRRQSGMAWYDRLFLWFSPASLLRGRLGRFFFGLSRVLNRVSVRKAAERRASRAPIVATETLLLQRVGDLMQAMPDALRQRLSDVAVAAEKLERAVTALREREGRVMASLAAIPPGSPARAEFEQARDRLTSRIAEGTSALEGLRLDLLRLNAGLVEADSISADVERVRQIGQVIDDELNGVAVGLMQSRSPVRVP